MQLSRFLSFTAIALLLAACGTQSGDPHKADGVSPNPWGRSARIQDVTDPSSPHKVNDQDAISVSGAVVTVVDTYDETKNGKSVGTIYVQDVGSSHAFSGISLFSPTFDPPSLHVGPGDTLTLAGQYQENRAIGTAVFPTGTLLPQISRPTAKLQYEVTEPTPTTIDIHDLTSFETGRQWLGMLVRVENVELYADVTPSAIDQNGRLAAELTQASTGDAGASAIRPPTLVNELFDVSTLNAPKGTKLKSVTGVVSFFFNLHIAPRSLADIER